MRVSCCFDLFRTNQDLKLFRASDHRVAALQWPGHLLRCRCSHHLDQLLGALGWRGTLEIRCQSHSAVIVGLAIAEILDRLLALPFQRLQFTVLKDRLTQHSSSQSVKGCKGVEPYGSVGFTV